MTHNTPVRMAIVGTGLIARVGHLRAVRELKDDVELVAAVDIDDKQLAAFADESGVAGKYSDMTTMLKEEAPDLVVVATPPVLHRDQVAEALEAGCWVWCEKPPALSLAEYDEMCAGEKESGPYASIVFQLRFGPGARHHRELISGGRLGRPLAAMCQTTWYRDDAYFEPPWRGSYRGDGGPTMALGIHQIDLLLSALGPWRDVSAFMTTTSRDIETEDVGTAIVRFESGVLATVITSAVSPQSESRVRIDTELATVSLSHLYRYSNADWSCVPAEHVAAETAATWANPYPDEGNGHTSQLRQLLADFHAGRRPETSGPGGRAALELITAMNKSARTAEVVSRGDIDSSDPYYRGLSGR